jgi:hypothetical protein
MGVGKIQKAVPIGRQHIVLAGVAVETEVVQERVIQQSRLASS